MKKQKVKSSINLETLAGGAFAEKLNEALMQVAENIQNPNTEATEKRGITVNIKFTPSKNRQMVNTSIAVTTKLAKTESIDTQMIMGVNMRTGQIELAEYDGQIRGQLSITDMEQQEEPETPVEQAAPEPEQVQQATGKPLDLRNRGKKQEAEPVPGRDYDPSTGEIYGSNGRQANEQQQPAGCVVPIKRAVNEA